MTIEQALYIKYNKNWHDTHKVERKEYFHKQYLANPYRKWKAANYALNYNFKLTIEDYAWMEYRQERKCKICKETPLRLSVDHNHKTGKVRGLLCARCNNYLGWFEKLTNDVNQYLKG